MKTMKLENIPCPDEAVFQAKLLALYSVIEKLVNLHTWCAEKSYQVFDERIATLEGEAYIPSRIRPLDAIAALRISKTTFYQRLKDGVYPPLRKDGTASYWLEEEFREVVGHESK